MRLTLFQFVAWLIFAFALGVIVGHRIAMP
jgi:hypothetical protein